MMPASLSRLQLRIAKAATICYSMPNIARSSLNEKQAVNFKTTLFWSLAKAGAFGSGFFTECSMEDSNAKNSA